MIHQYRDNFRWDGIDLLRYKEEGTNFKSITRQILFHGTSDLPCQTRYFEIEPDGYSTLERHHHEHQVMIIRGSGRVLLDYTVHSFKELDTFTIPALTWHQFRAVDDTPFGFICIVSTDRDKPQMPSVADLAVFRNDPITAEFIRV